MLLCVVVLLCVVSVCVWLLWCVIGCFCLCECVCLMWRVVCSCVCLSLSGLFVAGSCRCPLLCVFGCVYVFARACCCAPLCV